MRGWARRKARSHVVVTTTYGATIRGILLEVTRDEFVICQARLLSVDREHRMDGDVVIPKAHVHFWQPIDRPLADDVVAAAAREAARA